MEPRPFSEAVCRARPTGRRPFMRVKGPRVVEVEVDLGNAREMFGGTEVYQKTRGVVKGMEKTLQNIKKAAEG